MGASWAPSPCATGAQLGWLLLLAQAALLGPAGGCGDLNLAAESASPCNAGCAHEFAFDVPGGVYIVRALLTTEVLGDLDYGPTENVRVLVDGTQHGQLCSGSDSAWVQCSGSDDVAPLLTTRNGGSSLRISLRSSAGVASFSGRAHLRLEFSVTPWLGPLGGGTAVTFGSGCILAGFDPAGSVCSFERVGGAVGSPARHTSVANQVPLSGGAVTCVTPSLPVGASGWYNITVATASGTAVSPTLLFYAYGSATSAQMRSASLVAAPEANTAVQFVSIQLDGGLLGLAPVAVLDRGRGFVHGCTFGSTHANLVYDYVDSTYACLSPAGVGSQPLSSIELNAQQHTFLPGLTLTRDVSLSASIGIVQSVAPIAVPRSGGTNVSVRTANLGGSSDYRCLFDPHSIVAADYSATTGVFSCRFPSTNYHSSIPDSVSLQIATDGIHFSDDTTQLRVYSVSSLECPYGPAGGGHVTQLHGRGFLNESNGLVAATANRKFKFGHDTTPYIPLAGTMSSMTITSPPGMAGNQVSVEVTFIANEPQCQSNLRSGCYTSDRVLYSYIDVASLLPASGPISGDTNVTVIGVSFGVCERVSCKFGTHIVDAQLINSTAMWCVSPPVQFSGVVAVAVSMNGIDFSTASLSFMYYDIPAVTNLLPREGSQYSCNSVNVTGANFSNGSHYMCRFDDRVVDALYSRDIVHCTCTAWPAPSAVILEVSLNGQQFTSSAAQYTFAESRIMGVSPQTDGKSALSRLSTDGPAVGQTTVDIFFSYPSPDLLEYACVWNGYPTPAIEYGHAYKVGLVDVGRARCRTPRALSIPLTNGRTSFEESPVVGTGAAVARMSSTCADMVPGTVDNTAGNPVVTNYGVNNDLLLYNSASGLRYGQGRWELLFRTTYLNTTTTRTSPGANVSSQAVDMCPAQLVGVVQNFTDIDGSQISPQSGKNMYTIHGIRGSIHVALETVNLTRNAPGRTNPNTTFACFMRMGSQSINRAKLWVETNTGTEFEIWAPPQTVAGIAPEPEPSTETRVSAMISLRIHGRASADAVIDASLARLPSIIGNTSIAASQVDITAYEQMLEAAVALLDSSNKLRDFSSEQGRAAREQFRFAAASTAGVNLSTVNITSATSDPSRANYAIVTYTVRAAKDISAPFIASNFSEVFAVNINSSGTQLAVQAADVLIDTATFTTDTTYDMSFIVNRTDNVSDIVNWVRLEFSNSSAALAALQSTNVTHSLAVRKVNVTELLVIAGEVILQPEPEPEPEIAQDVLAYRTWREYKAELDLSSFSSAVFKFGAYLEFGNETYFFDSCRVYEPVATLPFVSNIQIKARYGITVDSAVYSFHAPSITSITPQSGLITGGTHISVDVNFPGTVSSTIYCGFNGVLLPAVLSSAPASACQQCGTSACAQCGNSSACRCGSISCVAPSLDFCSNGSCVATGPIATLSMPVRVDFRLEVDGLRSSNTFHYIYTAVPSIGYIWPVSGVSSEVVLIVGQGLSDGTNYQVRFGTALATRVVYKLNSCEAGTCRVLATAPGGNTGTVVTVELSLNGQQFTNSGAQFTYTDVDECAVSPCSNGAQCLESADTPDVAVGAFACICVRGWGGTRCDVDLNECVATLCLNGASCIDCNVDISRCRPAATCQNGAACIESGSDALVPVGSYQCVCSSGWNGTHCEHDIDECLSHPCQNGATCLDSMSPTPHRTGVGRFVCLCTPGYANRTCSSDVNECISNPCQNGARCSDSTDNASIPVNAYSCACAAGFANGMCAAGYIVEYSANCSVSLGGNCDIDIDECISRPCSNSASCEDSSTTQQIRQRAVSRALGVEHGNISDSQLVASSVKPGAPSCSAQYGRLNMGVDGWPDFTAAWCPAAARQAEYLQVQFVRKMVVTGVATQGRYNTGQWVTRYRIKASETGYTWPEQNAETFNGNVDEMSIVHNILSKPLVALYLRIQPEQWHAWPSLRVELYGFVYGPISFDAFSCTCLPGYSNGVCDYVYMPQEERACNVAEGGTCDVDVDECASRPCNNGATCSESTDNASVALNSYSCSCSPGFTDGMCGYSFIANVTDSCNLPVNGTCGIDVDECLSNPCLHGATCTDSTSFLRLMPTVIAPQYYLNVQTSWKFNGSLSAESLVSTVASLVENVSQARFATAKVNVSAMDVSTKLRLIIPDHSREFDRFTEAGNRSRAQLVSGIALTLAEARPSVHIASVQYRSSYSALPGNHSWINPGHSIPVGLEDGSVPDSALSASSHWRDGSATSNSATAANARLNGQNSWVGQAVAPAPAPVGIASGVIPDSAITASSAYYVKANMATWTTISAVINNDGELQEWLGSNSSGLSNPKVCISLNGIQSCRFECTECNMRGGSAVFPMYLALDTDHGHSVDIDQTIRSFMRWKHPGTKWNGWRRDASARGDMRGQALFVTGLLGSNATLRSENQVAVVGYASFQVSPDLGDVRFPAHNARVNSSAQWLPMLEDDPQPWIQVDIGRPARVIGIATQGAAYNFNEWVTSYSVSWSSCDVAISSGCTWTAIDTQFSGNADRHNAITRWLSDVVVARFVRIHILAWYRYPAFRFEILEEIPWNGDEWVQVEFAHEVVLTGLSTQGSASQQEWVTAYSISYKGDNGNWAYHQDEHGTATEFCGNENQSSVYNQFGYPIEARYARLHVRNFHGRAALRMEFFRESLDYFVVDAAVDSPMDTSDIVYNDNFTRAVAMHTVASGNTIHLTHTDMTIFRPVLAADVAYNFSVHLNTSKSLNVSRIKEDLAVQLRDTQSILGTAARLTQGKDQVQHVEVSNVNSELIKSITAPEPEPAPEYVPVDAYVCSCLPGWANGACAYDFIVEYTAQCSRTEGGHCDVDVNECASTPCRNGATCVDLSRTKGFAYADSYTCHCRSGFANGVCDYRFISEYLESCTVFSGGNCNIDVDECISNPCKSGAICLESRTVQNMSTAVSVNTYRCMCAAGYANGTCNYAFVEQYRADCVHGTGGDCGIDVDECISNPCQNGARCSDSTDNASIPVNAYSCACAAGFANGMCAAGYIVEYSANCSVSLGGNCDIDIDECISRPCLNGATCSESSAFTAVNGDAYRCSCIAGYANGWCAYAFINAYASACTLAHGGHCDVDADECASRPCLSNSSCIESSLLRFRSLIISEYMEGSAYNDAVEIFNPTCRVVDLAEYSIRKVSNGGRWSDDAAGAERLHGFLAPGEVFVLCHHLFDKSLSSNCNYTATSMNGINFDGDDAIGLAHHGSIIDAVGQQGVDPGQSWQVGLHGATTRQHSLLRNRTVVSGALDWSVASLHEWDAIEQIAGSNVADTLGFHRADLRCEQFSIDSYTCECLPGWTGDNCAQDINECASSPCKNGATCLESSSDGAVSVGTYQCQCSVGYADGVCTSGFTAHYTELCNKTSGGSCDVDMNECVSNPCQNGAACLDSSTNSSVALGTFGCACVAGFARGFCAAGFIREYAASCNILGGTCDLDIDECASRPCQHSANCSDSMSTRGTQQHIAPDLFSCACAHGFGNGMCNYAYVSHFMHVCTIRTGGPCNLDLNECVSSPCANGAVCFDSTTDASIGAGYYGCFCPPGFDGLDCQYNVDECRSSPCINNGTCIDLVQTYHCRCTAGWDGDDCEEQIDPCRREEDDCSDHATCVHIAPGAHACNCHRGYQLINATVIANSSMVNVTNETCMDVDECRSHPCRNGGICDNLIDAYRCACLNGYLGWQCQIDVDECASYPCSNAAVCADRVANFSCACAPGYVGNTCTIDYDECASSPCSNGATCDDSKTLHSIAPNFFACSCAAGFAGQLCAVDIDECASQPCKNGATCWESSSGTISVEPNSYHCSCAPGFAGGWCRYSFLPAYLHICRNISGGHCDVDINECRSSPCSNRATCVESSTSSVAPNVYSCHCTPGFANGFCDYDFVETYRSVCRIQVSGRCDIDVNECSSVPCKNGAKCQESSSNSSIPVHAYRCVCVYGFDNECSDYTHIPQYRDVACTKELGGRCGIDVNECTSSPCKNGATCSESSTDGRIAFGAYVCTCKEGFTNGMCNYLFVDGYETPCSRAVGGACDRDVNECDSNPCQNGATCQESSTASSTAISPHAYQCQCKPGFANGLCSYAVISGYRLQCSVAESSTPSASTQNVGNCDLDVDECDSKPCLNGATCRDSSSSVAVRVDEYQCECLRGYEGVNCESNVDECRSQPCLNGGICTDDAYGQVDSFSCTCVPGYGGPLCNIDIAECAAQPCKNGAGCSEANVSANEYICSCVKGFAGANCAVDIDECASMPCKHPAPCTDGIDIFRCGAPLRAQLQLDISVNQWDESLSSAVRNDISSQLGIDISRVLIVGVAAGSVIVTVHILPAASAMEAGLGQVSTVWQSTFRESVSLGGISVVGATLNSTTFLGCPSGFSGLDCSVNIDECASSPCANLGFCVDKVASYQCNCQVGWAGHDCTRELRLDAGGTVLLSSGVIAAIVGSSVAGPVAVYFVMARLDFDISVEQFSYSLHAMASTTAIATATISTLILLSHVRPTTAGFMSRFRTMAPRGDIQLADFALPCPSGCSRPCQCPRGFEAQSASGASLCIASLDRCDNRTYSFCAAVMGDSSTTDSLAVDPYDSCGGPCHRAEQGRRQIMVLLGVCVATVSLGWAVVCASVCTHLHHVSACLPRWEWMFPPMFLVFVVLRVCSVSLDVAVLAVLSSLSDELAELIAAGCFEEEMAFVLHEVERHLGTAFGAALANVCLGVGSLCMTAAGLLLARPSRAAVIADYLARQDGEPSRLNKLKATRPSKRDTSAHTERHGTVGNEVADDAPSSSRVSASLSDATFRDSNRRVDRGDRPRRSGSSRRKPSWRDSTRHAADFEEDDKSDGVTPPASPRTHAPRSSSSRRRIQP